MAEFPELAAAQRMAVAKVAGAISRLGFGHDRHLPLEAKLAELHSITTDPVVLGSQLGDCIADLEEQGPHYQACVDLLRDAGADEQAAQAKLAWRLDRPHRRSGGSTQP